MIIPIFNIIIFLIAIIAIRNFNIGYIIILCAKIIIPYMVRFTLDPISISISDCFSLILIFSYWLHRKELTKGCHYPKILKKYFVIDIVSTLFLIIFSSGFVPYSHQFFSFFKNVIQNTLFLFMGYWAFYHIDRKKALRIIIGVALIAGFYGIFSYIMNINPYVNLLYLNYTSSEHNLITLFLEEERAGLLGRTSGTMTHPLAWGQFWNIILGLFLLYRKDLGKFIGGLLLVVGSMNIILCGSRSAIVALFVLFVFYIYSSGFAGFLKKCSIFAIFIAVFFMAFNQNKIVKRFSGYVETAIFFWEQNVSDNAGIRGSNVDMRVEQLEVSIDKGLSNFCGLGYNYQLYVLEKTNKYDSRLKGLESIVFKKLVEQGFIGLLFFIYTTIILYKYLIMRVKREKKIIAIGYFFSFMASIIMTGIQGGSWLFFFLFIIMYKLDHNKIVPNN